MSDLSWINTLIGVSGTLISGGLVQIYHFSKDRRERNEKRVQALNHYARALQDIADKASLGKFQQDIKGDFGSVVEMLQARKDAYEYLSEMEDQKGYQDLISPAVLLAEDAHQPPSYRSVAFSSTAQSLRNHISKNPKPPRRKNTKK